MEFLDAQSKKKPVGECAGDRLFFIEVIKWNLNNNIQRYTQIKCFDGDEAICHFSIEIIRQINNWLVIKLSVNNRPASKIELNRDDIIMQH